VFKNFAVDLARLSKCEERHVAAIITDRDLMQVYSIGLNGGPKGLDNCICNIGHKYGCIHAEAQAIAKCTSTDKEKVMFVTLAPCIACATHIINNGFVKVYYFEDWPRDDTGIRLLKQANIQVVKI
jgi:deoxycytidylate deaminase